MAESTPRIATGPALMTKLLELEQRLDGLATEARTHWSKEEGRMQLVDKFVDPALDLESLLKQLYQTIRRNGETMRDIERELRRLSGAVEVAIGGETIARECNGEIVRRAS